MGLATGAAVPTVGRDRYGDDTVLRRIMRFTVAIRFSQQRRMILPRVSHRIEHAFMILRLRPLDPDVVLADWTITPNISYSGV